MEKQIFQNIEIFPLIIKYYDFKIISFIFIYYIFSFLYIRLLTSPQFISRQPSKRIFISVLKRHGCFHVSKSWILFRKKKK